MPVLLIPHGSPEELPVALVQQGTTTNQRVITGTLETLTTIAGLNIKPPTLIIIGTVVTLHDKLKWFHGSHGFRCELLDNLIFFNAPK